MASPLLALRLGSQPYQKDQSQTVQNSTGRRLYRLHTRTSVEKFFTRGRGLRNGVLGNADFFHFPRGGLLESWGRKPLRDGCLCSIGQTLQTPERIRDQPKKKDNLDTTSGRTTHPIRPTSSFQGFDVAERVPFERFVHR
jgi:hypothetical protein